MANLRIVLTFLSVFWAPLFSFRGVFVLAILAVLLLVWSGRNPSSHSQPSIFLIGANTLFLALLYAPVLKLAQVTWLAPAGALAISGILWWTFAKKSLMWKNQESRWTYLLLAMALLVPLSLGAVPTLLLQLSPRRPPVEMIPTEGWWTACWVLLFWGSLVTMFLGEQSRGESARRMIVLFCLVWIVGVFVYRSIAIESALETLSGEASTEVLEWEDLIYRSKSLSFPGQEDRVLSAALGSPSFEDSISVWVSWAKELDEEGEEILEESPLRDRLLAIGGKPWEEEIDPDEESCVALEVHPDTFAISVLTDSGTLFQVAETERKRNLQPVVGPFVHMCLGSNGEPVLLEAGGRVVSVSGERGTEIMPTLFSRDAAFLIRIAADPRTGEFWILDQFGVLYRSHLASRSWKRDDRFVPYSKTPDGAYPTAQDIAVSQEGTLYFLNCYGEIRSSSVESQKVEGPIQGAHYFPDFPVAQSLGVHEDGTELVDRYGGFYHSPYPTDFESLQFRSSHLFPRSLPRRDPEVVDHVYLPQQRWLYLLTKSGRILTNKKWRSFWAR